MIFHLLFKSRFLTNENQKVAEHRFRVFSLCFLACLIMIITTTVIPDSGQFFTIRGKPSNLTIKSYIESGVKFSHNRTKNLSKSVIPCSSRTLPVRTASSNAEDSAPPKHGSTLQAILKNLK